MRIESNGVQRADGSLEKFLLVFVAESREDSERLTAAMPEISKFLEHVTKRPDPEDALYDPFGDGR